jgi:hypothetical protein
LPEDHSLTDEQRRDQEDHLVAAAHGERGSADPALLDGAASLDLAGE